MGNKTSEQPPAQLAAAEAALAIDEMKLVLHRNFDVLMAKIRAGEPLDDIAQRVHFRAQAAQVVDRCAKHAYALFSACRSEEHTSELQSLMSNSYAVFCSKKKT